MRPCLSNRTMYWMQCHHLNKNVLNMKLCTIICKTNPMCLTLHALFPNDSYRVLFPKISCTKFPNGGPCHSTLSHPGPDLQTSSYHYSIPHLCSIHHNWNPCIFLAFKVWVSTRLYWRQLFIYMRLYWRQLWNIMLLIVLNKICKMLNIVFV